jgi:hypothetical protein
VVEGGVGAGGGGDGVGGGGDGDEWWQLGHALLTRNVLAATMSARRHAAEVLDAIAS